MKKVFFSNLLMLLFTLLIISCEDDESVNPPDENNPPVAIAGDDVTVSTGSTVTLDGSNSTDPDGDELSYQWSIASAPAGSTATITNATEVIATFVPDVPGSYTLRLTVDDGNNATHSDDVVIIAEEETGETIEISSDINEDQVWENIFNDPSIPDYRVTNNIKVNARLTVNPGVRVEVSEGRVIIVESGGGVLMAEGEEDNPIVITSTDEDGEIRWGGLLHNSSSTQNSLNHVVLRFGGGQNSLVYADGWRAAALAVNQNANLSITNTTFSRSRGDGLFVLNSGNLTSFEDNTFVRNEGYPLTVSINQLGIISATNLFEDDENTNNRENVVRVYDSNLNQDQEWYALGNGASYRFVKKVSVEADLTIHEGTILEFEESITMEVTSDGVLKALGTTEQPVVFTGSGIDDGKKWGGLLIKSSSINNELDHVQVLHAGGGSSLIYVGGWYGANIGIDNNARLKITNTEVAHSATQGLVVHSGGVLQDFGNNNFHSNNNYPLIVPANMAGMLDEATEISGNGENVVQVYLSTFDNNARYREGAEEKWVALHNNVPYLISGKLTVDDDLAIAEGTTLAFGDGVVMEVSANGSLNAVGTEADKITFTAYETDGSHNWGGIVIKASDSKNMIRHAEISFGGNYNSLVYISGWRKANIAVDNNASLDIDTSEISNSGGYGIAVHPGSQTTIGDNMSYSNNAMEDEYIEN